MPTRILLVNPNVTEAVTELMLAEAFASAAPATTLQSATAAFGTNYVENRAEAAIAAHAVLDAIAPCVSGTDAVVVAAYGDPGVEAARELFDMPVVGITEASLLTARLLGRRHAIVCLTPRLGVWYRECAEGHGLADRLVAVRALDAGPADIARAREECAARLLALCERCVDEDGAEVLILGGGPIAGLARDFSGQLPVPVLDGVSCGIRMAEMLAALGPAVPRQGSFARPAAKASEGLSPALTDIIEARD